MYKIHHYAIEVQNVEKVCHFYKDLFGFIEEQRMTFENEELIFLKLGEFCLEIIRNDVSPLKPSHVHLCFQTNSLEETMKRFSNARIKVEEGPYYLKNGWKSVFYKGLAGEVIEILEV